MSKDCVEKFFRLYSGFQSVKSNGILRKKNGINYKFKSCKNNQHLNSRKQSAFKTKEINIFLKLITTCKAWFSLSSIEELQTSKFY